MKRSTITVLGIIVALLLFAEIGKAQEIITLEQAIDVALENNIGLKRAKNNALIAKANKFQALMNYLPSLTAAANYDFFFGTFFDTNAARQISAITNSSNPRFDINAVLFGGFANTYNLKQRNADEQAAQSDIEGQNIFVKATVMSSYLNVLIDKENIKISENRIGLLRKQLEREIKRESVGVGNIELVYNFRSQVANERLNRINFENQYQRDLLTLIQTLQLDPKNDYDVESYDFEDGEVLLDIEDFDQILAASLDFAPDLKRAEANNTSAIYQMKAAKVARYPTVNFFARIGSNYSSNGAVNPNLDPGPTGGENFEADATFWDQMGYNQFEYFNFSLNIPIFNRWQTNTNIQVARINMVNSELDARQAYQDMTNTVQTVYLDLVSAQNTYRAAEENLTALTQSYEFSNKRYQTGNTDFFTYLESLNNKNRAEIQFANAKYSIVFRKKILDIYKGIN